MDNKRKYLYRRRLSLKTDFWYWYYCSDFSFYENYDIRKYSPEESQYYLLKSIFIDKKLFSYLYWERWLGILSMCFLLIYLIVSFISIIPLDNVDRKVFLFLSVFSIVMSLIPWVLIKFFYRESKKSRNNKEINYLRTVVDWNNKERRSITKFIFNGIEKSMNESIKLFKVVLKVISSTLAAFGTIFISVGSSTLNNSSNSESSIMFVFIGLLSLLVSGVIYFCPDLFRSWKVYFSNEALRIYNHLIYLEEIQGNIN